MKKLLIVMLCLMLACTMFAGCASGKNKGNGKTIETKTPGKIDIVNADFININGLDSGNASDEQIAEAMGRQPDLTPVLGDGSELMIYNDVIWLTVLFHQVQYSRMDDHLLVTYCYTLDGDETMDGALENLRLILNGEYGEGTAAADSSMFQWKSEESGNVIRLYALNDTEIRLQYTFANP